MQKKEKKNHQDKKTSLTSFFQGPAGEEEKKERKKPTIKSEIPSPVDSIKQEPAKQKPGKTIEQEKEEKKQPVITIGKKLPLTKQGINVRSTITSSEGENERLTVVKPVLEQAKKQLAQQKAIGEKLHRPVSTGHLVFLGTRYDPSSNKARLMFYNESKASIISMVDKSDHKPYLLTDESPENILSQSSLQEFSQGTEKIRLMNLLEDKEKEYTKLYTKTPNDVPKIRGSLRSWEDKIPYHHCWIYDNDLLPGMPYVLESKELNQIKLKPASSAGDVSGASTFARERITELQEEKKYSSYLEHFLPGFLTPVSRVKCAAFDIETGTIEERIPRPELAEDTITCICIVGNDGQSVALVLERVEQVKDKIPDGFPDIRIRAFKKEEELLQAFFEELENYPFIVTFNGNNFDIPYLYTRCKKLRVESNLEYNRRRKRGTFSDKIHIDLYSWFDNPAIKIYAFGANYKVSSLDEIAKSFLGEGKIAITKSFGELAFHELIYYCWKDSKLTLDLLAWQDYLNLDLMVLLQRICHVPLEDLINTRVSNWIRNLFFYFHRQKKYLIPKKKDISIAKGQYTSTQAISKDKKYMGAIVIEPQKGVHFNVTVLDFASLYPSIMSSYNLSYETVNCPHEECKTQIVPGTGYWTCTKRDGIFSTLVGFLKDVRVKWFKPGAKNDVPERQFYSVAEKSLKVLINASYGVMGAEIFPLYCLPVADATTAIGRHAIKKTVKKCEELGLPVLYGDTDSVFVKEPTPEQIRELKAFSDKELKVSLEIDKEYRYCALSDRKKNYIGIMKSGAVDIKGLIGKKSNTPLFLQQAFNETIDLLSEVKSQEDYEKAIEKIKDIIRNCYQNLEKREYSIEELAFAMQLTRAIETYTVASQHVKAAKQLPEYQSGQGIKAGRIIRFVKTRDQVGVKPVEIAKPSDIDVKTYKSHVDSVFSQVLDAFDISLDAIKGERKVNLSEFFR
ncbi:MAG: DNA-directed DNA polymerase I [Candidatus Hodarchaeales archaeon]